jgi:hypothetical protein
LKPLIVLGILAALLVSCGGPRPVVYRITGTTGNVDVTLKNASGGTEQRNVAPPYTLNFDGLGGQVLYLSGQNKWDAGMVTCEILVDGKVVQTASSSTPFGIATCSGGL